MKDLAIRSLCVLSALAAAAVVRAAADAPAATPAAPAAAADSAAATAEKRAAAEKLYRDLYGAEHDRVSASKDAAEKLAFAKKLIEAAKVAADSPETVAVLREHAAEFAAADPAGFTLALELLKETPAGPARDAALQKLAVQADKILLKEKPAAKAQAAADLLWVLREWARSQSAGGQIPAAAATLDKAKSWVRAHLKGDAALIKEIDEQSAAVARAGREAAALKTAQATLQAAPNDPAANTIVGLYAFLHETDPGCKCDACKAKFAGPASQLAKSAEAGYRKLAEALAAKEPADLQLGDGCRAAAQATADKANKEALNDRAVRHYKAALEADPSGPDALRVQLLVKQLAPETAAGSDAETKTAETKTADAKPAEPKPKPAAKPAANTGPYPARKPDETQDAYAKRCAALLKGGLPPNDVQFVKVTVQDDGKTVVLSGWTTNTQAAGTMEQRAKFIPGVESVENDVKNSPFGAGQGRFRKKF